MTGAQRTNLTKQRQAYLADIRTLEQAMISLASQEYVSVSLSSGGGSKSFSRASVDSIPKIIDYFAGKVAAIDRALRGAAPGGIRNIQIVRC